MDPSDEPPTRSPPPPPKRLSRPKITLQIPDAVSPLPQRGPQTAATMYWGPTKFQGRPPGTPASHVSGPHVNPYFNPFTQMYQNKASDFMFKQFAGFKDFTMNTAKSGLSAGEKTAFWFYNKLRLLSKKWFTHMFLFFCLGLYSVMGAAMFMALEGPSEEKTVEVKPELIRQNLSSKIQSMLKEDPTVLYENPTSFHEALEYIIQDYEEQYTEVTKAHNKKTWTFWNAMFYAGTIYTTIGKNYC